MGSNKVRDLPTGALADVPATLPDVDIGHRSRAVDAILCQAIVDGANASLADGLKIENEAWGRVCETKDMRIGIDTFIKDGPRAQAPFEHC